MSYFETTSFDKLDSAGTPRSGLFFKFCRLFGKEQLRNFVNVLSEDKTPPNKGELTNLIDGNTSTIYESGKENSSVTFYFPYHKIKIIKYSLTSEGKPTDIQQMKNWTLQGTKDNNNWVTLNKREKVQDIQGIARAQVYDIKNDDFFKAFKITSIDYITLSAVDFFGYAEADSSKINFSNQPIQITTPEPIKTKSIEESNNIDNDLKNTLHQQLLNRLSKIYSQGPKTQEIKEPSNADENSDPIILSTSEEKEDLKTKNKAFLQINDDDDDILSNQDETYLLPNIANDIHIYTFPPKIVTQEDKKNDEEEEKKDEEEEKVESHEEEKTKGKEIPPEDKLPLPKPEINSKDQHWMSISLSCKNSDDFYNGMFKMMKSRFSRPSSTTGFVEIFADTKKQMPLSIHNLVDCMKATDWYSTKMENPSISLYFPFHSLTILAIGFRSHSDKHFGRYFLKNFEIYAINDKKEIISVGCFETNKLNDYEAKATYQLRIPFPIRALRIVSKSGKFGLSFIELYGIGVYNEIKTQFSKDFLTNPSYYQNITHGKLYKDYDNPHKSIKSKFVKKMKKILDANDDDDVYVREWSDHSDDEENEKKIQEKLNQKKQQQKPPVKLKPVIEKEKPKEINIDRVEAIDPNGPSIIQQYEYDVDDAIQLDELSKNNLPICSYKVDHKSNDLDRSLFFFFSNLKIRLTGIKIRTSDDLDNLPSGFNFLGHHHDDENLHEKWRIIFSSPEEELLPNRDYYYQVNAKEDYTDFILRSYVRFKIDFIDFYGTAIVNKKPHRDSKEILEIKKNPIVLYDCPPIINTLSNPKRGIFAQMKEKYGTMLQGFIEIVLNSVKKHVFVYYCNNAFQSTNASYPGIIIYFCQHNVVISQIAITSTEKDQCLKRFIIMNEKNTILADEDYQFKSEEKHIFDLKLDKPYTYLKIFSLSGKFKCEDIELYGECNPNKNFYKKIDHKEINWDNAIVKDIKTKELNSAFEKERKNARPENPEILFSSTSKSYEDIIAIGEKNFDDFVSFYNYGNNGFSLLNHNENNLWMTSTTNNENSFKLLFNHHSVRLTKFGIHTPPRPDFEKYMPTDFYLFGYNSHTKRWDVLLEHLNENPLEIMSYYTFKIENEAKDNFYRMIMFYTLSGRVALAYITLFGDVIAEDDEPPEDEAISGSFGVLYNNMPLIVAHRIPDKFTPGIFRRAQSIFGPTLENFVDVRLTAGKDSCYFDIWQARRDCYCSPKCNNKRGIDFYFPHHIVFIEHFQIRPDSYPGLENFCIVGYKKNDDHGCILAFRRNYSMENTDSYYWGEAKLPNTGFRVIRFFGLDDYYSFKSLDFLGVAKPTNNVLTEKDMSSSYYIPREVTSYNSDDSY